MNNPNAFLFVTHELNNEILDRFYNLEYAVKDYGKAFLLLNRENDEENSSTMEIPSNLNSYIFNIESLNELNYEPIEETIVPGSNHFTTLRFFLDHLEFKYYWVIEYDVIFTGEWDYFFQNFNHIDADFITSHIERYPDKPHWFWWNTLHLDNVTLKEHQLIRSFNPIYRISNKALEFLNKLLKGRKNWGHHEVLIPTALRYWGFSILDFGGTGEFVLPQFEEKFYLMPNQITQGSMRAKPQINKTELLVENKLLHPFKSTKDIPIHNDTENISPILDKIESQNAKLLRLNQEILWANIFRDSIKSSLWFKNQAINPGRWAAGYPMLYLIYRVLQDLKPQNILELGLGESSRLTIQYAKEYLKVKLNIIEHDQDWLSFFANEMSDSQSFVSILPITQTLVGNNLFTNHYENLYETIKDYIYDFIIIDGPWGAPWHSRNQILEIVENNLLAEKFVIIMDDYDRRGEKQTINNLYDLLHKKNISYLSGVYSGNKDVVVVCSENYKFITSL